MKLNPIVRNFIPGLVERGKIKIGKKGKWIRDQFQMPEKLDHFLITQTSQGQDGNFDVDDELMQKLIALQNGKKLTEIPIRLLYNDISLNFQCRYVCYSGRTRICTGDGERAYRIESNKEIEVSCPCEKLDPKYEGKTPCKVNGCLSCVIDGSNSVGGVWKFRTTSYNSVSNILSSLTLIKTITGGPIAGIPLILKLNQKTGVNPKDGKSVKIFSVSIEYRGSEKQLMDVGYKILLENQSHLQRMELIEEEARKLISVDASVVDDDDIPAEFYPEQESISAPEIKPPIETACEVVEEVKLPKKTKAKLVDKSVEEFVNPSYDSIADLPPDVEVKNGSLPPTPEQPPVEPPSDFDISDLEGSF